MAMSSVGKGGGLYARHMEQIIWLCVHDCHHRHVRRSFKMLRSRRHMVAFIHLVEVVWLAWEPGPEGAPGRHRRIFALTGRDERDRPRGDGYVRAQSRASSRCSRPPAAVGSLRSVFGPIASVFATWRGEGPSVQPDEFLKSVHVTPVARGCMSAGSIKRILVVDHVFESLPATRSPSRSRPRSRRGRGAQQLVSKITFRAEGRSLRPDERHGVAGDVVGGRVAEGWAQDAPPASTTTWPSPCG